MSKSHFKNSMWNGRYYYDHSWETICHSYLKPKGKITKYKKAVSERPGQECRGIRPAWVCLGDGDAPRGPAPSVARILHSDKTSRLSGQCQFKKVSFPIKLGFWRVGARQEGF